jgi:hypothetical protein
MYGWTRYRRAHCFGSGTLHERNLQQTHWDETEQAEETESEPAAWGRTEQF